MIWRSTWSHHAATPVVGYTIIGFFGPVVSLIISIGMANVAGATKKSFTAAAIFIAYCVGNVWSCTVPKCKGIKIDVSSDSRTATHQDTHSQTSLSRAMARTYHLV